MLQKQSQLFRFDPANWYWKVGSTEGVYSSATNTYVAESDTAYQNWLSEVSGRMPSKLDSEAEVWGYVRAFRDEWLFNGTTFAQPTPTSYTKAQLKAYSAATRYRKETGGMTINGVALDTSRESQGMINGAYNMAVKDATFTTQWKCADGAFTALNAAQIEATAVAIAQHVQACFAAEADVASQIDSGAIISLPLIDQAYAGIR
ncbi:MULTISPECIES: DUF4376 domain-containing protein [unclassified Bradyrhizobium]|uniref:DUF4376 domain-containing protein n=1 Tax=unclassified Bradyrhizobium TaxID=2631580 RepID=UPI002916BBD8|nr:MULTISPECIES: DUF4376 domain-containing protein [unclassified Bradyrhizobium]